MSVREADCPATVGADGATRYRNVVFAGDEKVYDIAVSGADIAQIAPAGSAAQWVCLPPLADLHVHANRAYTPPIEPPCGLDDAVRKVADVFASFSAEDYRRHAGRLYAAARRHGTTRLRTHADVDDRVQLACVEGSLQAAADCADKVAVDVVAFASSDGDPATRRGQSLLRNAVGAGASFLGAAPAFTPDPQASIDALLDLAVELDVPVDLHLDEHLDPAQSSSEYLALATIDRELEGRVTLSHGCAIAALSGDDRLRTIERLALAEITVIVLPRTNLYLQDAAAKAPLRRGVAPARQMAAAGIPIRFASDNVQDAFFPYGDADLLGVAMDGVLACQLFDSATIVAAICDGRIALRVGDRADMLMVRGSSITEVLAERPAERWLIRAGKATLAA